MVKNDWLAGESEVHRSFRIVVNHKRVVAREQSHISIVGNTAKTAELEFQRSACGRAGGDVVDARIGFQLFLGIGLRAELAGEVAQDDVVGSDAAGVRDSDVEGLEGTEIGVALAAVAG